MPIKFIDLAAELGCSNSKLSKIRKEKLIEGVDYYKGDERCPAAWFSDEGAEKARLACAVPLAVPERVRVYVVRGAPNPRWVYCKLPNQDQLVPVVIPRKLCGRLVGKYIFIDIIKDAEGGITYRHEQVSN